MAALIVTAFHLGALGYINYFEFWGPALPDIVAGRLSFFEEWQANAVTHSWNSFVAIGHLLVAYYLVRHEFKWFRSSRR